MQSLRRISHSLGGKHFALSSPVFEDQTPVGQANTDLQDVIYLVNGINEYLEEIPEARSNFEAFHAFEPHADDRLNYELLIQRAAAGSDTAQFSLARRFYDYGNFNAALYWYKESALNHNTRAMNNLALMYLEGSGVPANEKVGTMWLESAVKRGDSAARTNLGIIVCRPKERENRDYETAINLFTQVAEEDNSILALNNLACCYVRGYGTNVNYKKARKLFKRAIELGSVVAKYNLGIMYLNGLGVKQNLLKAQKYLDEVNENEEHPEFQCLEGVREDPTKFVFFTTMLSYTTSY